MKHAPKCHTTTIWAATDGKTGIEEVLLLREEGLGLGLVVLMRQCTRYVQTNEVIGMVEEAWNKNVSACTLGHMT